jgi:hypothetical protein
MSGLKLYGSITAFAAILAVTVVLLGRSDGGQINVGAVTAESEQNATGGDTAGASQTEQRQPVSNKPNGGLVGTGKPSAPTPAPQPASTSTEETATTTDSETTVEEDASE